MASSKADQLLIQKGEAAAYRKLQADAQLCLSELREEIARVADPDAKRRLASKVANLEDCFDNDDWLTMKDSDLALKVAVLGSPHAGQSELISKFLGGLYRLTGEKSSGAPIGKRTKAQVPLNGKEKVLLLHASVGDPGPQVLAWADAFVLVFNSAEPASIDAVNQIHPKVVRYRRADDLPYIAVSIEGLLPSDVGGNASTLSLAEVKDRLPECNSAMRFVEANPTTGTGVDRLFSDLVHGIVNTGSYTKSASPIKGGSSKHIDGRMPAKKEALLVKHHIHGGTAERWVTLVEDSIVYYHSRADYRAGKPGKTIMLLNVSVKLPMHVSGKRKNKDDVPYFALQCQDRKTGKLIQWKFETRDLAEAKVWQGCIEEEVEAGIGRLTSRGIKNNAAAVGDTKKFFPLSADQRTRILACDGNSVCADCGDPKVKWVSLNLTVAVCDECCGIHRNMGVHISRMRSLVLDDWQATEVDIAVAFGNAIANRVYEAVVPPSRQKPKVDSPNSDKATWIRDKYEHCKFLNEAAHETLHQVLFDAIIRRESSYTKLNALAHCVAVKGSVNCGSGNELGRSPLHAAAIQGDPLMVQLLLWADADPNALDEERHAPSFFAKDTKDDGHTDCAELLSSKESRPSQAAASTPSPTSSPSTTIASVSLASPSSVDVLGDGSSLASAMNGDVRPRTATLWDQTSKPAATFTQDRQEKATTAPQQVSSSSTVLILESREPDAETDDFVMIGGAVEDSSTTDHEDSQPKSGADFPTTSPHPVENGDGVRMAQETEKQLTSETEAALSEDALQQVASIPHREIEDNDKQIAELAVNSRMKPVPISASLEQLNTNIQTGAMLNELSENAPEIPSVIQEPSEAGEVTMTPPETSTPAKKYTFVNDADVKTELKKLLRQDKVKLWEPPYTGPNNEDLISEELVKAFVDRIDADPQLVGRVLSKIRESTVARKMKRDAASGK